MKSSLENEAVSVLIHPSQFPHAVEEAMRESLRTRRMNHKFHYDTPKQTLRWLRVHEAFSPARKDQSCLAAYTSAFNATVKKIKDFQKLELESRGPLSRRGASLRTEEIEIVSLGCGGGQKEAQLIRSLGALCKNIKLSFVPVDVSGGLALISRQTAIDAGVSANRCKPFVVDLVTAGSWLEALWPALKESSRRIVTFFGMMPNFTPGNVLPRLAGLLRSDDLLLVSANLAPGNDYVSGVEKIRPQYENALTSEWLLSVLFDLGVERADGELEFRVNPCPEGSELLRIEVNFIFCKSRVVEFGGEQFNFAPGERFQLFFSYRHTVERMTELLGKVGLGISGHWTNDEKDEGVFLCRVKIS